MKTYKTIEVLDHPLTVSDAWSDINDEYNIKSYFTNFLENVDYVIRLIGPSISSERIYIPSGIKNIISEKALSGVAMCKRESFIQAMGELESISKGDLTKDFVNACLKNYTSAQEAASSLNMYGKSGKNNNHSGYGRNESIHNYRDFAIFLTKTYYRIGWQKVIMSNMIIRPNSNGIRVGGPFVKILVLSKSAFSELLTAIGRHASKNKKDPNNIKISGLFAHDICLRKSGSGIETNYSFSLSMSPAHLLNSELKKTLFHGIVDIKSILKDVNNRSNMPYLYRSTSNYRMGGEIVDNFNNEIIKQLEDQPDLGYNQHYEEMDRQINELPFDAFENRVDHNNPINSLEV